LSIIAPAGIPETVISLNAPVLESSGIAKLLLVDIKVVVTDPGVEIDALNGCTSPRHSVALPGVIIKACGKEFIVNVFEDTAVLQPVFPVAVSVSVTEPAVISAGLGV